jgi:hypothetical protein
MELNDNSVVLATLVPDAQRLDFLPRHFGRQMMTVEHHLYSRLSELSQDYTGGYWNFYDLSNGGCYLAPTAPEQLRIVVEGNDFEGALSADAAGITVTLFTLSELAFRLPRVEVLSTRFHQLRDFAADHAEAGLIFRAID